MDNWDGPRVLLAAASPMWLAQTWLLQHPGAMGLISEQTPAGLGKGKTKCGLEGEGLGGHPASLSPATVCSKIKSEPARCKSPRKTSLRKPGWDDQGPLPLPTGELLSTSTVGWCLKSRHFAGMIYDSLFFGARVG